MGANISVLEADSRRVLDSLRRIVRELRQSAVQAERRVGISGAQLFVLQTLAVGPARSLNDLAARTLTHQSSVSVIVRRLTEQGLVRRRTSPVDARRMEIEITAAGRSLLNRAPEPAQQRLFAAIRRMSAARRKVLADALGELVQEMGAATHSAGLFFEEDQEPKRSRSIRRPRAHA